MLEHEMSMLICWTQGLTVMRTDHVCKHEAWTTCMHSTKPLCCGGCFAKTTMREFMQDVIYELFMYWST